MTSRTTTTAKARQAKSPTGAQCLAKFERSLDEELRVLWSQYRGKQFLNLRLFWKPDAPLPGKSLPPDGWVATKRGVAIRPDELRALSDAIERAKKLAEE